MAILIPAILTRDADEITEKLAFLESIPEITSCHIDFEDGVFVKNTTCLPNDLKNVSTRLELEGHMMVMNPQKYFHDLEHKGINFITLHYESFPNFHGVESAVKNLKAMGMRAAVAVNPQTDVTVLDSLIESLDAALVMSVNPGFQGNTFLPECLDRLFSLRKRHPKATLEIDGGIKIDNIKAAVAHGADRIVVGSGIWHNSDPKKAIYDLLAEIK